MSTGVTQVPNWWEDPVGAVREGVERDRGRRGTDTEGNPQKGGLLENIVGGLVNADDGSDYRQAGTENKYKATIEELKPGSFKPGMTESYYKNQIRSLTNTRTNTEFMESPQGTVLTAQLKNQSDQLDIQRTQLDDARTEANNRHTQQITALNNQNDIAQAQLQQNADFRKMDKGDKISERALALEIEQMRGNREDKRLEREHERYYDNKRTAGLQSLVAGLAALGAAFAL